jgi:hypothetical protein
MPNPYTATILNSTPIIILRLEAREAAASIILKVIHSSSPTSDNEKTLTETYIISSRRLKKKVKTEINTEKLLKIIISTGVKNVTVKDLIANYLHIYKTFFGRQTSKTRGKKKDSITVNTMRTSVNVIAASLRKNPVVFRTSPRVTITLSDSIKLRGLINLNAEINYIDKATYK